MKNFLLIFALLMSAGIVNAQTVTGKVTAQSDAAPLPGVSVLQKGTTSGTTTDADGNFTLTVAGNDAVLVFSFIGFLTQEVSVAGRTNIEVSLAEDITQLQEVVVTALGVPREKKALGYATATVGAKELTQTATPNFASALYGKAPGVRINTTPGGATSAVNITVRGVNTITGKSQPLIVLNGVPIRDGEVNNGDYWNDQRLRGNGLLDINPEDIENISILKGASAAALYGSDAVNGVVLITTKTGKGTKGFKVDFTTSYSVDKVAYLPRYQNVRGAGAPLNVNNAGQDAEGFIYYDTDGDGVKETRGILPFTINFGPKFDGKPTMSWDGVIRPYEAQEGYASLFQPAHNKVYSIAVSNGGETSNTRFSFTRQENEGLSIGSTNDKNIFNLSNHTDLGKKFSVDVAVNYINQNTKNRPYSIDRLTNNFTGMIGRFDNGEWYLNKYKTSKGYRFVTGTNQSLTPDENIIYNGMRGDLMDYVWRVKENRSEELSDRILSSITTNWKIVNGLSLRGRLAADITSQRTEYKNSTEIPLTFGNSGMFQMDNLNTNLMYGDAMLTYTKAITPDIELNVMGGYSATRETSALVSRSTNGGLSTENMFDVSASVNTPNSSSNRYSLVKDAFIGTLSGSYKDFIFLEGTLRRDRTSTMHPSNNSFVYPSVNSSFVFSEAVNLPQVVSYGKLRASWGIVGNYPDRYLANIAYDQNTLGVQAVGGQPVLYTTLPSTFGNDEIKPEQKHEIEFGLETRFADNRVGFDLTYYNGQIRDQILPLTIPSSSGATSVLTNIGTLRNKGLELAISGTPIKKNNVSWDITLNLAKNTNVVEKLASGSNELLHQDYDGNAAQLRSTVGQPMGDFYIHPVARHANGGLIVDPNGLYKVDPDTMVRVGNAMPKLVGGLINTFNWKGFSLTAVMDFRYGGHVMPTAINWMVSRGLLEESLNNMDEEHGGFAYYEDASGNRFRATGTQGPNGETVYHDGMLLEGVNANGEPNTYIASATEYYWVVYNWGGPQYSPNTRYELYVKENSYIKMREIALSYTLPRTIASKIRATNIQLSVFGRNLFYVYRTLKDLDAEQTTAGSRWYQNLTNVGTNPSARTIGGSVRVSF
ncbi:MAG TPA: SusC/RagA family TonB-linked outer membrane protein [Chryseosolibacter sp.]